MSTPSANLSVWVGENVACIRVVGRANFTSSVDFKKVVGNLKEKGCRRFVLELEECPLMDSTFLGVLAGLGVRLGHPPEGDSKPRIELLHPNDRIRDLLENLGISHLFQVINESDNPCPANPAPAPSEAQEDPSPSQKEISRTCLEAHQTLMEVNPDNVPKFKDVADFLAEDLKRLEEKNGS